MSYFTFIDGKKYDRSLLQAVRALIDGKNGRGIEMPDAERIRHYYLAGSSLLTAAQRRSLYYIADHSEGTLNAKNWLRDEVEAKPVSWQEKIEEIVEEEFSLYHLNLNFHPEILARQLQKSNAVGLEGALRKALQSFLLYAGREDSLRNFVQGMYGFESGIAVGGDDGILDSVLRDHLNHAELALVPEVDLAGEMPDYHRSPARGEAVRSNWVFGLLLHDVSDRYFWAVIDRSNLQDPYNYSVPIQSSNWRTSQ